MTSFPKPTVDEVKAAYAKLTNIALRKHFFSKLENPHWLRPLIEIGVFVNAPEPLREGHMVRFLDWPELNYVSRVANDAPDEACAVISKIFTDNYFIQRTALEIAQMLPANLAALFVNGALLKWYKGDEKILSFTSEEIAKLSKKLAAAKEEAGIEIVDKLIFSFFVDKSQSFEQIKPRIYEDWHFEQAVKIFDSEMTRAFGEKYFKILCYKLKYFLALETGKDGMRSVFWRHAIEDHEQDEYGDGVKNILVGSIRDSALTGIRNRAFDPFPILTKLAPTIFHRLELYLSGETGAYSEIFLEKLLNSPDFFWDMEYHREIFHFLKHRFASFDANKKTQILEVIFRGPPDGKYIEGEKSRKYAALEEHLFEKYKQDFEKLPKGEHPDFHIYSEGVWSGPSSPIETVKIEEMSVKDIVSFISEWKPTKGWRESSPRGLGREIESDVKKQPAKYLYELTRFQLELPTYVSHVFSGVRLLKIRIWMKKHGTISYAFVSGS